MPEYIPGMTKAKETTPDRMDVRVAEDLKERLGDRASRENRSRNAQAAHYIEMGLDGLSGREIAETIMGIDAKLTEILRRLDEMQRKK